MLLYGNASKVCPPKEIANLHCTGAVEAYLVAPCSASCFWNASVVDAPAVIRTFNPL